MITAIGASGYEENFIDCEKAKPKFFDSSQYTTTYYSVKVNYFTKKKTITKAVTKGRKLFLFGICYKTLEDSYVTKDYIKDIIESDYKT